MAAQAVTFTVIEKLKVRATAAHLFEKGQLLPSQPPRRRLSCARVAPSPGALAPSPPPERSARVLCPQERYGGLYSEQNVALSGTHTHSGPAGYLQYLVYGISSLGFARQTFDALVEGIVEAVVAAHEGLAPGRAYLAAGELLGANVNRSPTAYLANPEEERARYAHDVDKEMTLLKLVAADGGR